MDAVRPTSSRRRSKPGFKDYIQCLQGQRPKEQYGPRRAEILHFHRDGSRKRVAEVRGRDVIAAAWPHSLTADYPVIGFCERCPDGESARQLDLGRLRQALRGSRGEILRLNAAEFAPHVDPLPDWL